MTEENGGSVRLKEHGFVKALGEHIEEVLRRLKERDYWPIGK